VTAELLQVLEGQRVNGRGGTVAQLFFRSLAQAIWLHHPLPLGSWRQLRFGHLAGLGPRGTPLLRGPRRLEGKGMPF